LAVGDSAGSCRAATIALDTDVTGRSIASALDDERFPGYESRQHEWNDAAGNLRGNVVGGIMSKLWSTLSLATRTCIALAVSIPLGALLLQVLGGAIAEQLQVAWQSDGMVAVLVLVVAAEVAMIAGGEV